MTTKTVGHTPGPSRVYTAASLPPSYEDHGWRMLAARRGYEREVWHGQHEQAHKPIREVQK